jgi:hypothetical protein
MLNLTAESELTMILSAGCERTFVEDADYRVHLLEAVVIDAALFILCLLIAHEWMEKSYRVFVSSIEHLIGGWHSK